MSTVSVIIPTYNYRDFVLATLDSVFAQTFTDYEVIVINDGSPDDTAVLLRPLTDGALRRTLAEAGYLHVRQYTWKAAMKKLETRREKNFL